MLTPDQFQDLTRRVAESTGLPMDRAGDIAALQIGDTPDTDAEGRVIFSVDGEIHRLPADPE